MATKSILKSVCIKEKNLGRNFIEALEIAKDKKNIKDTKLEIDCKDVKKDEIKGLFGSL